MRVLIVDDEIKICRLISNLIEWDRLGFDFMGFCHDGEEALETIKKDVPDIVITDIRMPNTDGLMLIEKIKAEYSHLHIIIVSGFSDFEYAHTAIKFGVEDYILKPIRQDELNNALQKIVVREEALLNIAKNSSLLENKLNDNNEKLKRIFLERLVNKSKVLKKINTIEEANSEYGCKFGRGIWQLAVIQFIFEREQSKKEVLKIIVDKIEDSIKEYSNHYYDVLTYYKRGKFFVLFSQEGITDTSIERDMRAIRTKLKESGLLFDGVNFYYSVTRPVKDISKIGELTNQAEILMSQRFVLSSNSFMQEPVVETDIQDRQYINELCKNFVKYIDSFQIDKLRMQEKKVLSMLKTSKANRGYLIRKIYFSLIEAEIHEYKTNIRTNYNDVIEKQKNAYDNSDDYFKLFSEFYNSVIDFMESILNVQRKTSTKPIHLAQEYIDENYSKYLTLDIIGKEVGLNPVYLSTLFKQKTQQSIVDYIADVRISHARRLLIDKEITIIEVAEATGFSDAKYFSKTFKKITGLSPKEYRKLYY